MIIYLSLIQQILTRIFIKERFITKSIEEPVNIAEEAAIVSGHCVNTSLRAERGGRLLSHFAPSPPPPLHPQGHTWRICKGFTSPHYRLYYNIDYYIDNYMQVVRKQAIFRYFQFFFYNFFL